MFSPSHNFDAIGKYDQRLSIRHSVKIVGAHVAGSPIDHRVRGPTVDPRRDNLYATHSLGGEIPMIHDTGKKVRGDDEAAGSIRLHGEEGKYPELFAGASLKLSTRRGD